MEESTEEDHHGVQQDIQQIHKLLGENEDLEELEESDDNEEEDGHRKEDGAYSAAGTSSSEAALPQVLPDRPQDSRPVPESLSLARPLEPSAENLLQINLSYQDMVCTFLDNIKAARKKNATIQKSVASKTTTYVKGARPIAHFQKHYFSGHPSIMPPLSDEARDIKAMNIPTPFIQPAKSWSADEDRALYEGVRNDGLQRCMKPLMARQEILYGKRRSAIDDEKQQLTREINDITTRLEHLKAPEEELLGDRLRDTDWLKISSLHLNGERTEVECQLRWQNILHPSINKKTWANQEEARLDQILDNARGRDWTDVINELGTNRSPFDCFANFQNREISQYVARPFSQEEDEVISELAERFKVGNRIEFNKVAYFMDQRLARQISRRWDKKLNPKSKWGYWTKEEDVALQAGVEQYGHKWSKIKEFVIGRQSSQIRDRWLYTLNPNNKKGNYVFKEDIAILQCVKEYGVGNWVTTANKLTEITGITRTPNSVLHRFNSMFHRFFKKVKGISLHESASMEVLNSMPLNTILEEMIEYRRRLGEKHTDAQGSRNWKDLYKKRKKRKPRSPPPPLMAKNASYITRQNVLSELDQQLMDAIKPIGWALPIPGTWREFYGSKELRRRRRHYIFSVLLKALDVSIVGNESLLASMVTNAEGIKILKDNQLLPKATETTALDDEKTSVKSKAKSSKSKVKSKKSEVKSSQSGVKSSQSNAKSSQSDAESSEKIKKAMKSSHRKKEAGVSASEVQQTSSQEHSEGQSSQQPCITNSREVSQSNVTQSQGKIPIIQSNVTALQGKVPMSQANVMGLQSNVTVMQGKVPMSQANIMGSQSNFPIPMPLHTRVPFAPTRMTVKSEFVLKSPPSIFGEGTLKVGDGYLVPVQNYVSHFGGNVPAMKLVTLMHPRIGGGIQTPMQFGSIPIPNQQPYSVTAPLPGDLPMAAALVPIQSATTIPQMVGVPAAMAPVPMQPAANILQPLGSPIVGAPLLHSVGTIPRPQKTGIIHVPGKGYLVPLNCIKQESVAPAPPPPFQTRKTNITTTSRPTNVIAGREAGVASGVTERHPAPGSTNPATLTPSNSAASQPAGNKAVHVTVDYHNTGVRVSIQEAQNTVALTRAGQTSVSKTTPCSVPSAPTSNLSSSSAPSVVSCEQQECGTLEENGQSSMRADVKVQGDKGDKDVESPKDGTRSDPSSTSIKKFDPVLPVLPPNEATITGLMALLLQRKRLEVNAGKGARIKKFKSSNYESNDKGILRGREGLLQELSSNETVEGLPQDPESDRVADKETHSEPVQHDPADCTEAVHTKADCTEAKVTADTKDTGKSKWERRTPVPVGALKKKKQRKKKGDWVSERSSVEFDKALNSIRSSTWYKTLQPRFLSMFLWPAMLSIAGPHRKKVLLQKKVKKTNLARQTENQPSGSKSMNLTEDVDEAGNTQEVTPQKRRQKRDGRRKYKTPPKKLPQQTDGTQKRKPSVKKKDIMKQIDGVARRTRSSSQKKIATPSKYVDIPSDMEEPNVPNPSRTDRDKREVHPQVFMAFGYPAAQKGIEAVPEAAQTRTEIQSLHQSQEEEVDTLSGPSGVKVHSPSQKASSDSVSFSIRKPETVQRSPTTSGSQSTRSPTRRSNSNKRLFEEDDVIETLSKWTKHL